MERYEWNIISFWHDRWLCDAALIHEIDDPTGVKLNLKVKDFWNEEG